MRRQVAGVLALLLAAMALPATAGTRMLLVARDNERHLLAGFRFAYEGIASQPTTKAGATELELPPGHRPGEKIEIFLVTPSKRDRDWFLVNPQMNIPDAGSAEVVLMRRSDFRQVAAEARDTPGAKAAGANEPTAEDRRRALVDAAARHGLTAEQAETALRSFADTQDPKDRGIAAYLEDRYSRAEELLNGAAEKQAGDLVETLGYLGAAQYEQAKYRAAAESFRKALALHGEDTGLLSWLVTSLQALAEWTEAERLARRALAIDEKSYGPDHPAVATGLNNLAAVLEDTNRLAEAEAPMRRALAINEKNFGQEDPKVATCVNNLASLLMDTNRRAEAEPLMRRALAIDEKSFGQEHPRFAIRLNNLALLLKATNRHAEAEILIRRALAIDEKRLGSQHPRVAIDLSNLAQLLQDTNRLAEAEPLMHRALDIDVNIYGPQHHAVARDLNNLAGLLQDTNRVGDAEPLIRRALAIDERSYGPDNPTVAARLNNLAVLLQHTDRLGEAEPLMRRALAVKERSYGPVHPDVAISLNNLAQLLQRTNRLGEAEPLIRRALAIDEKSYGPEHPAVSRELNNLAELLEDTDRLAEAEPLMRRALVILLDFGRRTGHEHPNQGVASENYRHLLEMMGKSPAEIERTMDALVHRSP